MKATQKLSEKMVTNQIVSFMRAHRWRAIRLQSGLFSRPLSRNRIRIGEAGMPDWLFLRPVSSVYVGMGGCCALFVEIKATRGDRSREQVMWADKASQDGFAVICVNSFDNFQAYWKAHYVD